jgi:hypothetical protein
MYKVKFNSVPDPAFPDLIKLRNVQDVYHFKNQKYVALLNLGP